MKRSTVDLLACPACRGDLALRGEREDDETVDTGSLHCARCTRDYPIEKGLPRFIQAEALTGQDRRFAQLYDWFSYVYHPFSRIAFAFLGGEDRCRRELLDRLEPKGGRVLEVSIGPGVNLPYLVGAPDVGEVYGLDISLGQLRQCRRLCRRRGWAVDLCLGTAKQLPFKDGSFEAVFHIGGINFFNDKQKAIEEMIRVARPGTRIVIADENERGARAYDWTLPGFKRAFEGRRAAVIAPIDLVPPTMQAVRLDEAWRGWFYRLEFTKPG